jgi:hypothetical protein
VLQFEGNHVWWPKAIYQILGLHSKISNEIALNYYSTGRMFEVLIPLRCQMHNAGNKICEGRSF